MRVALDAMGAERGISMVLDGALRAIRQNPDLDVTLVGSPELIARELEKQRIPEHTFTVEAASQVASMQEAPSESLRTKPNSSVMVAARTVRARAADFMVSCGNTGVAMAAALFTLGKLPGVRRPCLAVVFPTPTERSVLVLDVGANIDSRAHHLVQFAVMGSIAARTLLHTSDPQVGLINIGSEPGKGGDVPAQAHAMLQDAPIRFVGNIEGNDIASGKVDVAVCDGFIGNVVLKFAEGFARTTLNLVDRQLRGTAHESSDGGAWRTRLHKLLDYAEYGGAPLLGVNGICIIAHGASSGKAIKNAILSGAALSRTEINQRICAALNNKIRTSSQ